MRTPEALARLDAHQRLIADQLAHARDHVRRPSAESRSALAHARWQMARLLRAYQLFKHVEVFDPLCASADPARAAAARRLKTACIAAGERYGAYTRRWSEGEIEARWPEYVAAFEEMAGAIELHLTAERQAMRALLDGTIRTRRN